MIKIFRLNNLLASKKKKIIGLVVIGLGCFLIGGSLILSSLYGQSSSKLQNTAEVATDISQEKPIEIGEGSFSILGPKDWNIIKSNNRTSIVIQKPQEKMAENDFETTYYQKNMTIAEMNHPSPIDYQEMVILKRELMRNFSRLPGVTDYRVTSTEGVQDFQNTKGILLYSSFFLNQNPMTQLNLLISGANKSYLISFVDLSENFDTDFESVWASLNTIKVEGEAPYRYQNIVVVFAIISVLLIFFVLFIYWNNKRIVKDYLGDDYHLTADEDDPTEDEEPQWNLTGIG